MTTLAITPNWKNKSAKFKGTVAAGEHVSVTIQNNDGEGGEFIDDASTLRLRVVNPCNGRTLAIFPKPVTEGETPETWDSDLSPLRCTLNLNTVQMLKAVPPAANVPLLFVLDDYDNNTLYFKEQFPVEHWPRLRGEEEPTDLDNYKDIIADFNTRLDGYDTRITGAENAAQAATENASTANDTADEAKTIANEAVDVAQQAKEAAETSQESAAASATAAQNAAEAAIAAAESINSPDATLSEAGVAADAKATGDAIADEETRATAAEAAEETRAKGVESGLRTDLTAAQKAINDEAVLRATADADLNANKADKTAVAAISSDVAAAQTAISNLSASKADKATTYTKTEVDTKIAGVQTFQKYLVNELPDPDEADMKGLYLVPTGETTEEGDLCEEWTVVEEDGEKRWEKIGGTTVDLDNYYTKSEVNGKLDEKQAKLYTQGEPGWTFSTESTGTEIEAFMANAANYSVTEEQLGPTSWKYSVSGYDEENYYIADTYRTNQQTDGVQFVVMDGEMATMYGTILAEYSSGQSEVPAQVDTTPTANSGRLVTSGGIWSMLWGALAALPTGFASLYDWVVSQLAGKASTSDATLTPVYSQTPTFGPWTSSELPSGYTIKEAEWDDGVWQVMFNGEGEGDTWHSGGFADEDATSVTFTHMVINSEYIYSDWTMTRTRTDIIGYQLGSQTDKPLASEAEAEALRENKADKADVTLAPASQNWTVSPQTIEGQTVSIIWDSENEGWQVALNGTTYSAPEGSQDSVFLSWDVTPDEITYKVTGSRNGYVLGNQTDRTLASEAEVAALRTDKLDKADVVAPSTASSASGKAADAKATGDALAARPTKADIDAGWWSEWTILRNDTDITSQVGQPVYDGGSSNQWNIYCLDGDYNIGQTSGAENATSLSWESETIATGDVNIYTATRHRVAAPVPTKPSDIGAANRAANPTAGNLAALDTEGNPTDSHIPATNVATKGEIHYDRITITTGQLQDHAVQKVTLNTATTILSLPALTDLTGKVSDFGIDMVNAYEVSDTPTAASFALAGTIGTDYNLIVPEGEDWSEMSELAAGEMAQFYFTLSSFQLDSKPTWKVVKQVVQKVTIPTVTP